MKKTATVGSQLRANYNVLSKHAHQIVPARRGSPDPDETADLHREMMGVGSEDEMQKSVAAIEEGLQDVEAGRTRSMDAVFQELDDK